LGSNYLALAIDSRRTEDSPAGHFIFDDQCKIVPLSNRDVFIAEGIISSADRRAQVFDGFRIAAESYQQTTPSSDLRSVATLWADTVKVPLSALYQFYSTLFDKRHDNEIVVGYFLGFDNSDTLAAFAAKVLHDKASNSFSTHIQSIPQNAYTMLGPEVLVDEFMAGITPRARAVRQRMNSEFPGKSQEEQQMIRLQFLVQTIPLWANDPGSGGDIAQMIFEAKTQGWRWFHRPDFCPEH
jgi:hypothetical protein